MPEITVREAIRQALEEEMRRDERVFIMGEDVGAYGGTYAVTRGMLEEFGEKRVRDTPIAESVIVGAGIGAALGGLRPVVELMTVNFSLLAMDQIVNQAAKLHYMFGGQFKVPMVIRTPTGFGQLAATHSQTFENYFAYVPGLKVVMPATPYDSKGLLKSAIRDDDPVIFLEHSLLYGLKGEVPDGEYTVPLGQADVKRQGRDVTIVTYSRMVTVAMRAADRLAQDGIEAEIVDVRCLRPLDIATIVGSVMKTNHVVVAEEGWPTCGFGSELSARISQEAFDYLDAPVARVAARDVPMPYALNLEREVIPQEDDLVEAVRATLYRERVPAAAPRAA